MLQFTLVVLLLASCKGKAELMNKGCFSTSYVRRYNSYYQVKQPLSFSDGVAVCDRRLTKYVGLQISSESLHFVYCGNDLTDSSAKVDESICRPCYFEGNKTCGGQDAMSVYMLRENTPFSLLLLSDRGVQLFDKESSFSLGMTGSASTCWRLLYCSCVNYLYTEDEIIYTGSKSLLRSAYNYSTHVYNSPTLGVRHSRGCEIDFVLQQAYFLDISPHYDDVMSKYNLKTKTKEKVYFHFSTPAATAIDPYIRIIFAVYNNNYTLSYQMDERKIISRSQLDVNRIWYLAADIQKQLLYAMVSKKGEQGGCLVSLDYSMSNMKLLYCGSESLVGVLDSNNLDVFNGEVVWRIQNGITSTIYKCKVTTTCLPEVVLNSSSEIIYGLRIYHPERQIPLDMWLCPKMKCQRGCKLISQVTVRCTCPLGMKLNADNRTCSGEEVLYEGCYSTSFVENFASYYKTTVNLSLDHSLNICNKRLTTYIGIQDDLSSHSSVTYCGNDLSEVSSKAHSVECLPCPDKEAFCGGTGTMSVYMLREDTPLAVMVSTHDQVAMLVGNRTVDQIHYPSVTKFGVDYMYNQDEIIFITENRLVRSINNSLKNYHETNVDTTFLKFRGLHLTALGVDFVMDEVYLGTSNSGIFKFNVLNKTRALVADNSTYVRHICVDPYSRMMFYPDKNYIQVYSLKNNTWVIRAKAGPGVDSIEALALDFHQQLLYGIVTLQNTERHIVSWDYSISKMNEIYNGPELADVVSHSSTFDVYKGVAVWVNVDGLYTYTVYKCNITPKCSEKPSIIQRSETPVHSLKVYHPERKTPGGKYLCANLNCEHVCKPESLFSAKCACPEFMELNDDKRTCSYIPATKYCPVIVGC